jgi:hypothetical protein
MKLFGIRKALASVAAIALGWPGVAAEELPALTGFPTTERIWMGVEEGVIRPAAYVQVRSSTVGQVVIHAEDGELVEKGQHWATVDPEQLQLERESLELDQQLLERKQKESRQLAAEARTRARVELAETERRQADLTAAIENPEFSGPIKQRAKEAIAELDEKIAMLVEKIEPEAMEETLRLETEEGRLGLAKKQKVFDALEKRSVLTAGFAGQLKLADPIKERIATSRLPERAVWVEANEHLATIVDDSLYEITIAAATPLMSQIPSDTLLVLLQEGQSGRLIEGRYLRTDEVDMGGQITRNYVFTVDDKSVDFARHAVGQRSLVHVYRKFPERYHLVSKREIAFRNPEILERAGWAGLVMHLWPGSQVIQVGPQTIAVEAGP